MKTLIVFIGKGGIGRVSTLTDQEKAWVIFACVAIVALAFWYFVFYKEDNYH